MKRLASVSAALLVFILFFQLNHIGLMSFLNPHGAASSCVEAKKTRAAEKCLCCLIEQADKSSQVNVAPFIPSLRPSLIPDIDFVSPAPSISRSNYPRTLLSANRWLNTVVQRK